MRLLGKAGIFALGLTLGATAHSSYSCVRDRAGDALTIAQREAPMDLPSAIADRNLRTGRESVPTRSPGTSPDLPPERLPSAAEGDMPRAGAAVVAPAREPTGLPDLDNLRARKLTLPVAGVDRATLRDTFAEGRTGHVHEAIDIMAPRGTAVLAVEDGRVEKIFTSAQGGLTLYQFDPGRTWCYYYAHLDRYAPGLAEGQTIRRGQILGYVGTSGNAPPQTPHLHFTIFKLPADKRWWRGAPVNPFPLWAAS